ncbi:hypothetical protein [Sorangium sp. So ce117]|uniref:hypothetical protein n=1 Tax=Sorangium sp. So ce117 TaxID=3133277 RepID=UPI003F61516C
MKNDGCNLQSGILSLALAAVAVLSLVACGETDESTAEPALDEVGVAYQGLSSHWGWAHADHTNPYTNRCVNDAASSINALYNPNYVMAYRSGSDACSTYAPTTGTGLIHHQGIQRLARDYNYLLVTTSVQGDARPGFEVVRLGSLSNNPWLLGRNASPSRLPSCSDAIVHYQSDDSGMPYDHSGGLQVNGEYVIVPFEKNDDQATAGFRIARLSNPLNPQWSPLVLRTRGQTVNAGAVSLTLLSSGRYLAFVFGHNSDDVEVFVSSEAAMPYFGSSSSTWISQASVSTPFGGAEYQGLQLVTQCDGQLFVAGTHRNKWFDEDWVDLWRVDLSATFVPGFTEVASRHMSCSSAATGNKRYCAFDAGAGIYVDPDGEILLYGVEHYNDAYPGTTRAVKVREFP